MAQDPELKATAMREPSETHKAFVKFVKAKTGFDVDLDSLAVALRLHPHFRHSPEYAKAREATRSAREAEAAAARQRATDRLAERIAKAEQRAAELRAKLEGNDAPPPKAAAKAKPAKAIPTAMQKAAKAKATKPTKAAEVEPEEAPPNNVTELPSAKAARPARARRGRVAVPDDESDPF